VNALVDDEVIKALYAASQAGVKIRLLVRGVCCLRPGVPGVSENVTVRSIVGRFLEHSRVYRFENDGDPEIYLASADWTARNFFGRVEICFPVEERKLRERVDHVLSTYWKDNVKARELNTEAACIDRVQEGERVNAQEIFLEQARKQKKPDVAVRPVAVKRRVGGSKANGRKRKKVDG
jgi:polyphosphate kinase